MPWDRMFARLPSVGLYSACTCDGGKSSLLIPVPFSCCLGTSLEKLAGPVRQSQGHSLNSCRLTLPDARVVSMSEEEGTFGNSFDMARNEKLAIRPSLIDAAIADRIRRHREILGLSQSALGLRIALGGLPWWKSATVGITEAGRRKTHIYEVAAIARVFELSPEEFLSPDPDLDDEDTAAALQRLCDRLWPKPEGGVFVDWDDDERPMNPELLDGMLADLRAQRMSAALVELLTKKLGTTVANVNDLALLLWGKGPGTEMQARLAMHVTEATPQARGHITRQLLSELGAFDNSLTEDGDA